MPAALIPSSSPNRRRFVALRMATLARTPGFRAGPAAENQLAALWARGLELGLTHVHTPHAQVLWFRDPATWFGGAATLVFVDRRPEVAMDLELVRLVFRDLGPTLDGTTWLEVAADDRELVKVLCDHGLGIDSVIQVGDPRLALERLVARWDPPMTLRSQGLELDAAGPTDVDAIVALHAEVFSAEPAFCWFGAYPAHLQKLARAMRAVLSTASPSEPAAHFVVRHGDAVVGHVDAEVDEHPFWGAAAGLAFVLAPPWRERGIVKTLYRAALTSALARGATCMRGGTSQPAILALGRAMGRPWHSVGMRPGAPFPAEHFWGFAP